MLVTAQTQQTGQPLAVQTMAVIRSMEIRMLAWKQSIGTLLVVIAATFLHLIYAMLAMV